MRASIWLISIIFLACGSNKKLAKQTPLVEESRPSWVQSKPISSIEYVGVGRAQKRNGDHALLAKRAALNDLASEIEVTVSSESVMYTLEHDSRFEESFTEAIFLNTDLDLEGFEAYDSWENDNEYWLLYRLDKLTYERIKAKKRSDAVTAASDQLDAAFSAFDRADPVAIASHSIRALELLQPYWNMPNPSGRFTDVGIEAIQLLAKTRAQMDFGLAANEIILNEQNEMNHELIGGLKLNGKQVSGLDVRVMDGTAVLQYPSSSFTHLVRPSVGARRRMELFVDPFEELRNTRRPVVFDFLKTQLAPFKKELTVKTVYPTVTLSVNHDGIKMSDDSYYHMRSTLISALSAAGIPVATDGTTTHQIEMQTSSRSGGVSYGQTIVWTSARFILRKGENTDVTNEIKIAEVKGLNLDELSAQRKSVEKLEDKFDSRLLEALIDGLF